MIFLVVLEAVVLLVSAQVAIALHFAGFGAALLDADAALAKQAFPYALGMMAIMASFGLYQSDPSQDTTSSGSRIATAFLLGFAIIGLVSYLAPSHYPGLISLSATALTLALAGSLIVRAAFRKWSDLSAFKPRVLVLGTGSRVARLADYARANPNHQVVGYVSLQPAKHYVPSRQVLPMAQGESLLSMAEKHAIDEIVVAVRNRRDGALPLQQLLECKMNGVKVVELPTFFEREFRQVMLDSLNPSWMVLGDGFRQGLFRNSLKRLFDLTVSSVLLLLCLPVLLVTTLCICLESGLPVLYRQERVGLGRRVFTLYKLRSMKKDAERDGAVQWAKADDDRTTWVGRFIRKTRIDELPQIFNVLKGEMSFVGPRPERPFFVDQLVNQVPYYALRHSVKPGITGWAQVRYAYGASVDDAIEKLQHDLYYVKNHSLFLDIMILIATVEVVLWGKGAR
ncbi:MAG: TIGR03013 family PEP-CTERM/XrtA system glycosyltransferase [Betaproteobacteria bacterium]|nr:TIGR03013 family PEP-CTERM/XrtA system glycosyltransferase [Betaproteobacteria bacterium]